MLTFQKVGSSWMTDLKADWLRLQQQCPYATVFQTYQWHCCWWKHLGFGKPEVWVASDEGRVVGIAPMVRKSGQALWMATGPSDRPGALAEAAYWPEFAQRLCELPLGVADLQQCLSNQPMSMAAEKAGWHSALQELCPYVNLPESWDELAQRIGKKMRFNIGYAQRQMMKQDADTQIFVASDDDLPEVMTALFDLHTRRWRKRGLPGGFYSSKLRNFHMEWAKTALSEGWLRLHAIRFQGDIKAVLYVFHYNGRAFYYLGGFDLDLSKYSMGTVLTAKAIELAINEKLSVFDFLRGGEAYKYRWKPETAQHLRLAHAPVYLRSLHKARISAECALWQWLAPKLHGG